MELNSGKTVYYSLVLAENASKYQDQWVRSILSLRKYNANIPVHLFVYNEPTPAILETAESCAVSIHLEGPYRDSLRALADEYGSALSCIPTLNKLLPLGSFSSGVSQVLFIDCDTFFFNDVALLFAKYQQCGLYAREEAHSRRSIFFRYRRENQDEEALAEVAQQNGIVAVPPFNSGVMLFNGNTASGLFALRREFYRCAWRLSCGAFRRLKTQMPESLADAIYRSAPESAMDSIDFPSENFWILEQIALWLTVGMLPDLTHGTFSMEDVLQNGEFMLYRSYAKKCTVLHYFGGNELLFLQDSAAGLMAGG